MKNIKACESHSLFWPIIFIQLLISFGPGGTWKPRKETREVDEKTKDLKKKKKQTTVSVSPIISSSYGLFFSWWGKMKKKNLEGCGWKNSRSVNTAVSVSLLFHPVYGFFLTLKKTWKNPQKERTNEVDEKSKDVFLETAVSVSLIISSSKFMK
jgi:hypothetical protein